MGSQPGKPPWHVAGVASSKQSRMDVDAAGERGSGALVPYWMTLCALQSGVLLLAGIGGF